MIPMPGRFCRGSGAACHDSRDRIFGTRHEDSRNPVRAEMYPNNVPQCT